MISDNREAILARLVEIAQDEFGNAQVARNVTEITESSSPFIVIMEGDEVAMPGDLGKSRGPISPRRVVMTPQILIAVSASSASVGATLNQARAALIDAVLTDATLAALCAAGDRVRYEGAISDLASGRKMQGQLALQFRLTYVLMPSI